MNDGGKGTNTSVRESKTSTFNRISSEFNTHTASQDKNIDERSQA